MPFTFSHPAIVLPLNFLLKKRASLTALVVGSIVPDFEYFFRLNHQSFYSHTWAGLFWFDVPAGVLLCFIYHSFIRDSFYAHAPLFLKRRMAPYHQLNWNRRFAAHWPQILFCIFIAAFTHLVWDKILHQSSPMVQSMSGYRNYRTYDIRKTSYYLFWLLHTLIGAFLVGFALWRMPADKSVRSTGISPLYWLSVCGIATAAFFLQLPIMMIIPDNIAIAAINGLFIGLLLTSCLFSFRLRREKRKWAWAVKEEG